MSKEAFRVRFICLPENIESEQRGALPDAELKPCMT
jgi:hypothetical protein